MAVVDTSGSRRGGLAGLGQKEKLVVDISINDEQPGSRVPSYTTLDKIEGIVSMTATSDTYFDFVMISFQGIEKTYVEKVTSTAGTSRTSASHVFLRLLQPIEPTVIPQDRTARTGKPLKFPFTFVVPERLLPQACKHACMHEQIHEAHLKMPPTLGDQILGSNGKQLMNDLSPENTVISYAIRVMVLQRRDDNEKPRVLSDSLKKVRIIPAVEEMPPLSVPGGRDDDYITKKQKDIRKGLFKGKLGWLTVEAAQPKSLRLPPAHTDPSSVIVTTMAVLKLRFDPAEEGSQPPRLGNLTNKLRISTYFASRALGDFPSNSSPYRYDTQRGLFVETLSLSSRNVESVQWASEESAYFSSSPQPTSRRASAIPFTSWASESAPRQPSAVSLPSSSPAGSLFAPTTSTYYTTEILVPINLPTKCKTFVPTFHNCLTSRVYALELSLSVQSPSTTVSTTTLRLKIPLQISAEGNPNAEPTISTEEIEAITAREVDETLAWARRYTTASMNMDDNIGIPQTPDYVERTEDALQDGEINGNENEPPPEYDMFGIRRAQPRD